MHRVLNFLKELSKKIDYFLLVICVMAASYGIVLITSATYSFGTKKLIFIQTGAMLAGFVSIFIIVIIDYENLSALSLYIYVSCVLLLIATLIFGKEVYGNKNWIDIGPIGIQPSEFVKVGFIITFATHLNKLKKRINSPISIIQLALHFGLIFWLVLEEGDLGSALVYFAIFAAMLFAAGLHKAYFAVGFISILASAPFVFQNLLSNYQQMRILAVYDLSLDPLGFGYHTLQSKITLGSGGLLGSGLFKGIQTQYGILPAKQTDFIFSVAGEELGFLGTLLIIIFVVAIIVRILYIARKTRDYKGMLMCVGAASLVFFQAAENIGMCLGMLPVIGITLPFFSYGGSSMLSSMFLIGLVISVSSHRRVGFFKK